MTSSELPAPGPARTIVNRLKRGAREVARSLARSGLLPAEIHHRYIVHLDAAAEAERTGRREVVHAASVADAPLPGNVASRDALPGDAGWWGFSFRDVPRRSVGATSILEFRDAEVLLAREPDGRRNVHPAILDRRGRSLDLNQIRYRPLHAALPRRASRYIARGVWIAERVYDNHSHWLTAHLPKLILLRDRGMLHELVLPAELTPVIRTSLAWMGIDPERHPMIAPGERVRFGRLTLLETDRFRPELIRSVRDGFARPGAARRRVFVTRRSARGRRLREEEALLAALAPRGFEAVAMETLTFDQQVSLMGETEAIVAPHGAGLTNMIFCPPGATVVEIADADYPNPNFYALAAALVHDYRIVGARGIGSGHALDRDLSVDPDHVVAALGALGS
jgi:hypothetical protein